MKNHVFFRKIHKNSTELAKFDALTQLLGAVPRVLVEITMVIFIVILSVITYLTTKEFSVLISTLGVFGVASLRIIPSLNSIFQSIVLDNHRKLPPFCFSFKKTF